MITSRTRQPVSISDARIEHVEITSGRGKGNELLFVFNGLLFFEINVSRGFDIRSCHYAGRQLGWLSPCTHVSPHSYHAENDDWNRGFEGGLLTTCGLEHAGQVEDGYGLHGRFSYTEAEIEEKRIDWGAIRLAASISECKVGGHWYQVTRRIVSPLSEAKIIVTDTITNCGFESAPLMLLYHINWSEPFLDAASAGVDHLGAWKSFKGSHVASLDHRYAELQEGSFEVGICDLSNTSEQEIRLHWEEGSIQASLKYDRQQLPAFSRWRLKNKDQHAVAWEPGTVTTQGRYFHDQNNLLRYLAPSEQAEFTLEFEFSERKE